MIVSYDKFENLEQPILTLCNPNSEAIENEGNITLTNSIGQLSFSKKVILTPNFNSQWELSFEFSDSKNEYIHKMYKMLEKGRYVYVNDVGYFMIDDYSRHESDTGTYKSISCHSVEKEIQRNSCPLLDEGSYYFYTNGAQEGIIQKQMLLLPKWTLGFVSDDLKEKTAYFDGENKSENAYDFLWGEIEEAYECVIDVDLIKRKLNFYSLEYYAVHHLTDIHLSRANDLSEVIVESKDDDCFTAINVQQDDNLSLVYSNPNGSETLYNFDYVMEDMSGVLQSALQKWKAKCEATILPYRALSQQWAVALDDLSNAQQDLAILQEDLEKLQTEKDAIINADKENKEKNNELKKINAKISTKQNEITAQKSVINQKQSNIRTTYEIPLENYAKECSLELTAKDVDGNLIFTQELLNELSAYINPAEYTDEYITQTDDMKYAEIYEQSNKLFDRAKAELEKVSTQSYTFSVENNSFLFNKKFKRFSEQLCVGAIVYLETSEDTMEQVHLTNFSIDYDERKVSFTFGNKYDKNDIKSLFDDVFGDIKTSATEIKYLKNIVNDQKSELEKQRDWIDNALTLTKNHCLKSNNQAVIIDDSGYWGKRQSTDKDGNLIFDTSGNPIFDNEQLKIINNGVYLTTDNWNTIATAVGKIYLYHDDVTGKDVFRYGVAGDLIIGKLFLGKELNLIGSPRADGTYAITLNENGLTIINDGTTAGITIKDSNGNKQLYADSNGNLNIVGKITATSGNIGGWQIYDNYLGTAWGATQDVIFISQGHSAYSHFGDNLTFNMYIRDKFCIATDGSMYASAGNIGGWEIRSSGLVYWPTENGRFAALWPLGANVRCRDGQNRDIVIGAGNGNYVNFGVDLNGAMYATMGKIGEWNLAYNDFASLLYCSNSSYGTGMAGLTTYGGDPAFWAGLTGWGSNPWDNGGQSGYWTEHCNFYVLNSGYLYAKNAYIEGTINATSGSFTGTISAGTTINIGKNNGSINFGSVGGIKYRAADSAYVDRVQIYNGSSEINLLNQNGGNFIGSGFIFNIDGGSNTSILGDGVHTKSLYQTSDERKKSSIQEIAPSNEKFNLFFDSLLPVTFNFNDGIDNNLHIGFIAQRIKQSLIDSNLYNQNLAILNESDENNLCLNYIEILPLCVNEIQRLKKEVETLRRKITEQQL